MGMRKAGYWSIITILLTIAFIFSCSDNPSGPGKTSPGNLLTSVTIDQGGGTVSTDQIEMIIPAGSFNNAYDISVYEMPEDGAFQENGVSRMFRFIGLPNESHKPISVKIKFSGELGESSFIAMGRMQKDNLSNDSLLVYEFHPAADSSGYLICELAVNNSALGKTNNTEFYVSDFAGAFFRAVTQMKTMQTEHFTINYPVTLESSMGRVGETLETAWQILQTSLGLEGPSEGERWKVNMVFQDKVVAGSQIPFLPVFSISRDHVRLSKFDEIEQAAVKAFFRFLTYPLLTSETGNDIPGYYWIEQAIHSWMESYYSHNSNFTVPENFADNALAPFKGMRAGAGTEDNEQAITNHGIGMSSLIKYLVNDTRFGKQGVLNIYGNIFNGMAPTSALINSADALLVDWWPQYIKSLVNSEIYEIPLSTLLTNLSGTWNIATETDTLKVFSSTASDIGLYPDISAKLFKINVNHAITSSEQNLYFHFTDVSSNMGLSLVIFGIKNNALQYLGTANSQDFEIPDLKAYYDDNMREFLAVMCNNTGASPYLGTNDIDLTITTKDPSQTGTDGGDSPDYNHCIVGAQVTADIASNSSGTVQSYTQVKEIGSTYIPGSFNGNVFTGSHYPYTNVLETVTVILNDSHDMVLQVSFTRTNENEELDTWEEKGFDAKDIPVLEDQVNKFFIQSADICTNLTNFYLYSTWEEQYTNLTGYQCDESSHILVSFSKR